MYWLWMRCSALQRIESGRASPTPWGTGNVPAAKRLAVENGIFGKFDCPGLQTDPPPRFRCITPLCIPVAHPGWGLLCRAGWWDDGGLAVGRAGGIEFAGEGRGGDTAGGRRADGPGNVG